MGSYDSWKLATPPEYEFLGPDPDDGEEDERERCDYCGGFIDECTDDICPMRFPL